MTPDHDTVLAAIEKARAALGYCDQSLNARDAHCDDLRAIAERHAPHRTEIYLGPAVWTCPPCMDDWPCPDYQLVIDRLKSWGVLDD